MIRAPQQGWIALVFCLLVLPVCSSVALVESHVSPFLWKYRVILVDDPDGEYSAQSRFDVAKDHIADRHIVWFVLGKNSYLSNTNVDRPGAFVEDLRREYFSQGEHRVVLIGKDGGVKKRSRALDLEALFELIDSMPMRRREMKE